MTEAEREKQDARIGRLYNNVMKLPKEEQMYVLGIAEGMAIKASPKTGKSKKEKGA